MCVNFIHKWRGLQFKVDSERQIFEKLFMAILFTLRDFAKNLLRGNRRRNTFRCLAWDSNPGFRLIIISSRSRRLHQILFYYSKLSILHRGLYYQKFVIVKMTRINRRFTTWHPKRKQKCKAVNIIFNILTSLS